MQAADDFHGSQGAASARFLAIPLVILASLASYVAGRGLLHIWIANGGGTPPLYVEQVLSAALHLSWVLCACSRRAGLAMTVCWAMSLYACDEGLASFGKAEHSLSLAFFIEMVPLLISWALSRPVSFAERLARWRRARSEISVQLLMGDGLFHWIPGCLRQFFGGTPAMSSGSSFRRLVAELADAEHTLHMRLAGLVIPERLRQSILTSVSALVSRAERSAAALSIELEQEALNAAAACRDQCEHLDNLRPQDKAVLAKQCEALFLELVHPRQRIPELRVKSA